MDHLHIECPHCGASFDLELQAEKANMMVFSCARCKTPLMYCNGEVGELDKDEFAGLRKKLTRAIDAAVCRDSNLAPVAEALKGMLDKSNEIAEERASEAAEGRTPETTEEKTASQPAALTDETLEKLQKGLDELDADSFLDQL